VDDIQTIMTTNIEAVEKSTFSSLKPNYDSLMDYAFLGFCESMAQLVQTNPNVRIVIAGTNFVAPWFISKGSDIKVTRVEVSGCFPTDWIFNTAIVPYFQQYCVFSLSDPYVQAEIISMVEEVSYNRRLTHCMLRKLYQGLHMKENM
jgi:hypothetical protein